MVFLESWNHFMNIIKTKDRSIMWPPLGEKDWKKDKWNKIWRLQMDIGSSMLRMFSAGQKTLDLTEYMKKIVIIYSTWYLLYYGKDNRVKCIKYIKLRNKYVSREQQAAKIFSLPGVRPPIYKNKRKRKEVEWQQHNPAHQCVMNLWEMIFTFNWLFISAKIWGRISG